MKTHMMLAFLTTALAACGGKEAEPGQDWSGRPLEVTIEDQVGRVTFTIQAPKGMKRDEGYGSDNLKLWQADLDDHFSEPSFTITYNAIPPSDLDEFVRSALLREGEVIVKEETTDDGFVLVHHDAKKSLAYARVSKRTGEAHVECKASQAKRGGLPSFDKTLAWLEQLCRSLAIR